jgi:hypothetical protein
MKENPLEGDVRKLHGSLEGFRRWVGNWRIFFDVDSTEAQVVITAHRTPDFDQVLNLHRLWVRFSQAVHAAMPGCIPGDVCI